MIPRRMMLHFRLCNAMRRLDRRKAEAVRDLWHMWARRQDWRTY